MKLNALFGGLKEIVMFLPDDNDMFSCWALAGWDSDEGLGVGVDTNEKADRIMFYQLITKDTDFEEFYNESLAVNGVYPYWICTLTKEEALAFAKRLVVLLET